MSRKINQNAFWMPFTANKQFKQHPRLLSRSEGMYYWTPEGRRVLDGTSGLWCVNLGHRPAKIVDAIKSTLDTLDFAPTFQMGHPLAFELASKLTEQSGGFSHAFFTNCGSTAVDSALKMALAYFQAKGESNRTRLIGRHLGYHGVGFGGISVGGIRNNRKHYASAMIPGVDHLPHTLTKSNRFSRGRPLPIEGLQGLQDICDLHDASTIAAVIVEPVVGSAGVIPPPIGYLEELRRVCSRNGILLIFDEVITGFGRTGKLFASQTFGVQPDILLCAKGLTNGTVPCGAVLVSDEIHDCIINSEPKGIEFFHGYTYSGHPLAMAAGIAVMDIFGSTDVLEKSQNLSIHFENCLHEFSHTKGIRDVRNLGLMGAIELESEIAGEKAFNVFQKCFEMGLLIRVTGDSIALSPPLIAEEKHLDEMFSILKQAIESC